jgi:hypothetical protein
MYLLGSVQETLKNLWATYGAEVTPVLITVTLALLTWLAIKIKSDAKLMAAKNDLQIQALKDVANREDNKPQLEEQSQQINNLQNAIIYLGEMFNQAFQNSSIDPEIKSAIENCLNKIKFGTQEDLVKQLEDAKASLQEQVESLKEQLAAKKTELVENVKTRIRR